MRCASATSRSAVSSDDLPDRAQVEPQRVQAGLDREVDLRLARRVRLLLGRAAGGGLEAPALRGRRPAVGADDVDALAVEVGVELGDLLLRDLDLLQAGGDLLEGQEPPLLAFSDERAQLVDLEYRRVSPSSSASVLVPNPSILQGRISERSRSRRGTSLPMSVCNGCGCVLLATFVALGGAVSAFEPRLLPGFVARETVICRALKVCLFVHFSCPLAFPVSDVRFRLPSDRRRGRPRAGCRRCTVSLSRVGVTNVEKVVRIGTNGAERLYWAKLDCFVDLGPRQKGAHMSRFEEVVNDAIGEVVLVREGVPRGDARPPHRREGARPPGRPPRRGPHRGPLSRAQARARSRASRRRSSTRCSRPPSPPRRARGG